MSELDGIVISKICKMTMLKIVQSMEVLIKSTFPSISRDTGFNIEDYYLVGPHRMIILPDVWSTCIKPGWEVKLESATSYSNQFDDASCFFRFENSKGGIYRFPINCCRNWEVS